MASTPKKLVRPTTRTPTEDADPVGCARKFAEVDAGAGPGVGHRRPQDHSECPPRARSCWSRPRHGDVVGGILGSAFIPISSPTLRKTDRTSSLLRNANTREPKLEDQAAKFGRHDGGDPPWTAADGLADRRQIVMAGRRGLPHPGGCRARGGCDVAFVVMYTIKGVLLARTRVIQLSP